MFFRRVAASSNNGMNSDLKKLALFQTGYPKRSGALRAPECGAELRSLPLIYSDAR
jgi:hypothetical protein